MTSRTWSHDFPWNYFLVINNLLEMQDVKLKFGGNKFGKRTDCAYTPQYILRKTKFIKLLTKFIYHNYSKLINFDFI